MKYFFALICVCSLACNVVLAQSLGKMTLGCERRDIPLSLPRGYNICKTNTNNQLTYTTSNGSEYVSFYLRDNIVYKIEMHRFVYNGYDANDISGKLEELVMNLYDIWGEPSYVGENVYWQFPTSKATFSYSVSTRQVDLNITSLFGPPNYQNLYSCYADIRLEKKANLFE